MNIFCHIFQSLQQKLPIIGILIILNIFQTNRNNTLRTDHLQRLKNLICIYSQCTGCLPYPSILQKVFSGQTQEGNPAFGERGTPLNMLF